MSKYNIMFVKCVSLSITSDRLIELIDIENGTYRGNNLCLVYKYFRFYVAHSFPFFTSQIEASKSI